MTASSGDVYDGQGDYLTEAERELRWLPVRRFGGFVLTVFAGWTVAYWLYLAIWPAHPNLGEQLGGSLVLAIAGLLSFFVFAGFYGDLALPRSYRHIMSITCIAAFALGVALPMSLRGHSAATTARNSRQTVETTYRSQDPVLEAWLSDLHAAGAHGPLGLEPPMLEVEDSGSRVTLRNISDRPIGCLRVARVHLESPGYPGDVHPTACMRLEAGGSGVVEPGGAGSNYVHGPLEYRIGSPGEPEPSWWSDSALQADYGLESQNER